MTDHCEESRLERKIDQVIVSQSAMQSKIASIEARLSAWTDRTGDEIKELFEDRKNVRAEIRAVEREYVPFKWLSIVGATIAGVVGIYALVT